MKHGRTRFARAATLTLGLWAGLASTSVAQLQILDLNELPQQRTLDPMNRLIPTDPHVVIRAYIAKTLPSLWWGKEIDFGPGRTTVEVHIPDGWKGNPTSAMMRFCPQPNDNMWRVFKEVEMRPYYQKKSWTGWTCRL